MIVHSNEIIGIMIKWATKTEDRRLKDLWILSDFINGRNIPIARIVGILDSLDQQKDGVKKIREELHL